jgi:HK97 family phage prohead protease
MRDYLNTPEVRDYLTNRRLWTARMRVDQLEQRSDDDGLHICGYAAVFDSDSEPIAGMFLERIQRGAFKDTLKAAPDVRLLVNHDGLPLARTTNGSMSLSERPRGLWFEADLAPTTAARDLHALIERGDVDQMSFAFTVAEDRWEYREESGSDFDLRTITRIGELYEVSVVTFPAYRSTSVQSDATGGERSRAASAEEAREPAPQVEAPQPDTKAHTFRARVIHLRKAHHVPGTDRGPRGATG